MISSRYLSCTLPEETGLARRGQTSTSIWQSGNDTCGSSTSTTDLYISGPCSDGCFLLLLSCPISCPSHQNHPPFSGHSCNLYTLALAYLKGQCVELLLSTNVLVPYPYLPTVPDAAGQTQIPVAVPDGVRHVPRIQGICPGFTGRRCFSTLCTSSKLKKMYVYEICAFITHLYIRIVPSTQRHSFLLFFLNPIQNLLFPINGRSASWGKVNRS